MDVIQFDQVGISFGSAVIHKNISFKIGSAEVVTLLGPSGTGKTLILKMIMGLLMPTKGQVLVMGSDFSKMSERERRTKRKEIGMLFQGAALFDSLSVYENVAYSLREHGEKSEKTIADTVNMNLEIVGLAGMAQKYPGQLSGGQKKRVGLARALASHPKVMLFDEPTTGLDPTACRMIDDLIVKLKREYGITSLAVTHDIASAKRISDRWILVDKGEVVAQGPVEQVLAESSALRDFVSGNRTEDN